MEDAYTLAFNLIDEVDSSDGYWLHEAAEDYSIFQPPMSTLFSLNISSNDMFLYPPKQEISNSQSHDGEVIQAAEIVENFMESDEIWAAPDIANPITSLSVKKKLKLAFEYLEKTLKDRDILIQTWMPVKRGGKCLLTTKSQAFTLSPNCKSLGYYRDVSKSFQFEGEEENTEENKGIDIISRVFLKKLPEWTPDVRFFSEDEYLRVAYAQQMNICGSIVLPIFERDKTACLGVIEIVTTTQRVTYHPELEIVLKALETVDLRSSDVPDPPMPKAYDNGSYEAAVAEIQQILKFVCDQHGLPLAQTWASCIQQGKSGTRHTVENCSQCVSPIDSACYMPNPQVLGFYEACSEHHLLRGQGLVGEAFATNQPCFSTDVSAFSKTREYPLSHYARVFGLRASIAVRLRSVYTGPAVDFVLEFFLPFECQDAEQQRLMLTSISSSIQQVSCSLRVVTDQELLEETTSLERDIITPPSSGTIQNEEDEEEEESIRMFEHSRSSSNPPCTEDEDSWIAHMMEAQRETKPIEGEFKLTTHWDEDEEQLHYMAETTRKDQILHDSGIKKANVEYYGYDFSIGEISKSGGRKPVQKRRTKSEKSISLQVLRPYFSGSLKDAAKSIGVCPTTLKRICRQHGITRWPSRKIKKVEHSLRKLQNVIDSVQGVEDSFQLDSLYSKFNIHNPLNSHFTIQSREDNLLNDLKCQNRIDHPTVINASSPILQKNSVPNNRLMKLKVTFGEERVRFSMQQHWRFNDLLNEIVKRFRIEEHGDNSRIEIKYLDDDSEWVLLECNADLEECLDVHNSCGSIMIKLAVILVK